MLGGLSLLGGTVNLTNAGGLAAGTYTLIDYAGSLAAGTVDNLVFGSVPAGFGFDLVDTGAVINLLVSDDPDVEGDYNNDGIIDAADYVLWRKSPNSHGGTPTGYNNWRTNFGTVVSGSGGGGGDAAVPEPGTVTLLALAIVGSMRGMRRRS
jgi:hypothetical protein